MYPATQTFWIEPNGLVEVGLRRYASPDGAGFTCDEGYHTATTLIGTAPAEADEQGFLQAPRDEDADRSDPRWPTHCERGCGYAFVDEDRWQNWIERQYVRTDTGETTTLRRAEPGACWDAFWIRGLYRDRDTADGITLMVKCPNGQDWCVDSEASNCTRKGDRTHACWVRHGDPRECHVTVDKDGDTCQAGAGSIQAGDYHGFLQNGVLTAG